MTEVTGATTAQIDQAGDDYAHLLEQELDRAARQLARSLPANPTEADLLVLRTLWDKQLDARLVPTLALLLHVGAAGVRSQLRHALTAAARPPTRVALADVPPVPPHIVDAYLATARNRLTGAGDLLWEQAREQLREGTAAGEGHAKLARRIRAATGLALPRARVIARTEARDALLAGSLNQVRATGLTGTKRWVAVRSARTRPEHRHAHGQEVDLKGFFEVGGWPMDRPHDETAPPELTVSCFPAGTLVQASGVQVGYRRWYDGPLVKLTLASGHELTGTPNHPVKTPRGWVPLYLLNEGDDVIGGRLAQEPAAAHGHVDDVPTPIEQIVSALAESGTSQRVSGFDVDFHSDGRSD